MKDKTGTLLSRDVPTSHIVYKSAANITPENLDQLKEDHYEVQSIIDRRGKHGNYEYRVKWKGHDDPAEDTWEPIEHFDSTRHIELYWKRRNANKVSSDNRKTLPKSVNTRRISTRNKKSSSASSQ